MMNTDNLSLAGKAARRGMEVVAVEFGSIYLDPNARHKVAQNAKRARDMHRSGIVRNALKFPKF